MKKDRYISSISSQLPQRMCCQMTLELLIKEDSKKYIPHDQLFKQLIHTFFGEFMEAFFPEVLEHIDFVTLKPLSEQMYTDLSMVKVERLISWSKRS